MIDYVFLIAQFISLIAIALGLISDGVKETKKVYFFNGASNACSSISYFLLGAYTGAISCVIASARNIVFSRYKKKVPFYIVLIFILIAVGVQLITIKSFIDILPVFNICFYAICLSKNDERIIKKGGIIVCVTGFIYDLVFKAYFSVLYNFVAFFVGIGAYYIYFIKKDSLINNEALEC